MGGIREGSTTTLTLRRPELRDAHQVYELIASCPPLELNALYAYLLLCTHFGATSRVAEQDGRMLGFLAAYHRPDAPDTLFVWQVAVHPSARGQQLGQRMILDAVRHDDRFIEATVTPSNDASFALFESIARRRGAPCIRSLHFRQQDFGTASHEEEYLVRIGPLR